MPASRYYTADMVRALPDDGNRYETIHGELFVTPSPRILHQVVAQRLALALENYLSREPIGTLFFTAADISWNSVTLVQPDLFVAATDEVRTMEWEKVKTLFLTVEVLSPSSARADRFVKRRLYQEQKIPLYWIVDCDARAVEVWTPDALFPVVEEDRIVWRPDGAEAPCIIELAEVFAPV
ncbi:MAG: Uma2 family endonuclease [Gemmatimonadales bacterium]|nr:Uma2 family endonuclease [Gemmatimonadales bacterium]